MILDFFSQLIVPTISIFWHENPGCSITLRPCQQFWRKTKAKIPIFYSTRLKPAYGQQGLDWIVGPGYSFVVFSTNRGSNWPFRCLDFGSGFPLLNRWASEKSQYVYSERNLFIDIQKTSMNRNRDSAHKGPLLTSMIKNVSPTQGPKWPP